jgi:hypothetical protein
MNHEHNERRTRGTARRHTATKAAVMLGIASLGTFVSGATAWAGGNGAETQTFHVHGTSAFGIDELDLNPTGAPPGVSVPANCWLGQDNGIISTDGNGVFHMIGNKTGFWFTSTYTGEAAVYPLVLDNGVPVSDPNTGNNEVDTSQPPLATGHLTQWFGNEDNNKNGVEHATVTFKGTDSSGNPVNLDGHFQFAMNANGEPTATVGSITC